MKKMNDLEIMANEAVGISEIGIDSDNSGDVKKKGYLEKAKSLMKNNYVTRGLGVLVAAAGIVALTPQKGDATTITYNDLNSDGTYEATFTNDVIGTTADKAVLDFSDISPIYVTDYIDIANIMIDSTGGNAFELTAFTDFSITYTPLDAGEVLDFGETTTFAIPYLDIGLLSSLDSAKGDLFLGGYGISSANYDAPAQQAEIVPEPGTIALLALGLGGLGFHFYRRAKLMDDIKPKENKYLGN